MSDGTPPSEGEHSAAAAPPPGSTAVPPAPPQYSAAPPPPPQYSAAPPPPYVPAPGAGGPMPPYATGVPPYATGVPPYATQVGAAAPGAYAGAPRQDYPGAPPTWGPGPGTPYPPAPAPGGGSSVLAILALVAAVLGVLASFVPFVGALFSWLLIPAAIVLSIIALVRRAPGKGMAIAALIVAVVGAIISMLWALAFAVFGGLFAAMPDFDTEVPLPDDGEYVYPSLSAPEFGPEGTSMTDPLAPGTVVTIHDDSTAEDIWQLAVGPIEDITAAAAAAEEEAPIYGAYAAVPVELTNVSDEPIDLAEDYSYVPYSWLTTGDGGEAEIAFLYDTTEYPGVFDFSVVEPGETITYYEVFDVGAEVTTTGTYVVQLDSGQVLHWRPAES